MSSSNNNDWKSKLDAMEAEINRAATSSKYKTEKVITQLEVKPSPQVQNWLDSAKKWFNSLPSVGKIAVGVGAVWLSFSMLNAFVHIISTIISIAIMGLILYVGYKFLTSSSQ